ncbi:MAG: N-acetylmuramoyl-L-alanine amidase, partial [Limisphaerales bacterium]
MKQNPENTIRTRLLTVGTSLTILIGLGSAEAAQGPQPNICNRGCWGARAAKSSHTQMSSLTRAIIHHTAGQGDYTTSFETGKAKVRGVQNIHMDNNGWSDIGYHFLVNAAGHIYEGRAGSISSLPKGAHDGYNVNSFGFTLLGYFHSPYNQQAPAAMRSSLYDVIAWRMPSGWSPYGSGSYNSKTVGYLDGHRKVKSTACPGDTFHPVYITENYNGGEARNGVNSRKNSTPAPATPGPDASTRGANRLDVFVRGADNALWQRTYDHGWLGWNSLGGSITSDPASVSWNSNRIDVFARGLDGAI